MKFAGVEMLTGHCKRRTIGRMPFEVSDASSKTIPLVMLLANSWCGIGHEFNATRIRKGISNEFSGCIPHSKG